MSQNNRGLNKIEIDFFDVRGTKSAGFDTDQEFSGMNPRDRDGFNDDIRSATPYGRFHFFGDWFHIHGSRLHFIRSHG
jgi:hypothetical protein